MNLEGPKIVKTDASQNFNKALRELSQRLAQLE
jgi:hypothetical protein